MNGEKILQMMTTNREINALFKGYSNTPRTYPVMGLALTEDKEEVRHIRVMYIGPKGLIEFLQDDSEDFMELRPASEGLYTHEVYNMI